MEARAFARIRLVGLHMAVCLLASGLQVKDGTAADVRSENFIVVRAASPELAKQVLGEAERFRKELAIQWLGKELPRWDRPCTLSIVSGNIPAQGVTTYQRYPGYVSDFQMEVVGTPQRILDSVLPHEVTHTVLATHFGRPLPRWADEGISTTVEHVSERSKHEGKLREFLLTQRGIPMNRMFLMQEYPPEMLTLYAQGYSVCRFMINQKGPREFIKFLETYMQLGSWTESVKKHYEYESLAELQQYWLAWVESGSGDVVRFAKTTVGSEQPGRTSGDVQLVAGAVARSSDPSSLSVQTVAASTNAKGWYAQVRDGSVASESKAAPAPVVKPFAAAHPQPEQGAISSIPAGPASNWSPQPARILR